MQKKLTPTIALVCLILFASSVALLGGSSRPDAVQLVALRPLAALFLIPALYYIDTEHLRQARGLFLLLGALAIWVTLQLLPLPPSVWHELPGRTPIEELGNHVGMEDVWRPISLVPSRGWNTLASLIVPATALLLPLAMGVRSRKLLILLACVGVFDAALGLLQVVGGRSSVLYLYEITNRGSPVGLFANENHSAVFSAITLLLIARIAVQSTAENEPKWMRILWLSGSVVVLVSVLASGSRSGLILTVFAILAASFLAWVSFARGGGRASTRRANVLEEWLAANPRPLVAAFGVVLLLLISAFFGLERAPGFSDILSQSAFEDMRWKIWPVLQEMVATHWLAGTGFGSFEEVYHIFERTDLLYQLYVNQAHNDWAQLVIEGGVLAMLLLLGLFGWIAVSVRVLTKQGGDALMSVVFWGSIVVIFCTASVVDYPLRTPILMFAVSWLLLSLALERFEVSSRWSASSP